MSAHWHDDEYDPSCDCLAEPCRVYSHGADGWHCAVQGEHQEHRNAAGTETW